MDRTVTGRTRLAELKRHLSRINRSWSASEYEELLQIFVRLLPRTLDAERCGIFIVEPDTNRIVSQAGTGLGPGEIVAPAVGSVVGRVIGAGRPVIDNDLAGRDGFHSQLARRTGFLTHGIVCVPVLRASDGAVIGAIEVLNRRGGGAFTAADRELLEKVAGLLSQAVENARINHEMILLSQQLERELKVRSVGNDDDDFVAESDVMRRLVERAQTVAELPINVLILGENGTGKERIARMLHDGSERREGPFVAVNCAAIPESLAESEFFGYEKGAFTGATQGRGGRFEDARGGTLFLDEIGDLPPTLQPKFLRVLQEGRGQRLGSSDLRSYDFRVVSATNRDLKAEVASGRFREDLYYRLFSVELTLPPLRERGPDRVRLAMAFLRSTCRRFGKRIEPFTPAVIDLFERYPWPGNVRQLRNEVERLVAFTPDGRAPGVEACSPELLQAVQRSPEPLHAGAEGDPTLPGRVGALERELIREALAVTGGNREKAARRLGISRQGLYKKMERHGLS